ncbi:hypothetical protein [Rhodoferax sediminis]|nr:hypothetical protein [Rhodoferax sediminis]
MKMDGASLRAAYIEAGQVSLFRGLERFLATRPEQIPPKLAKNFKALLEEMPASEIRALLLDGLGGNSDALASIDQIGVWGAYRQARTGSFAGNSRVWVDHCVEVESASKGIDTLLRESAYAAAADAVKTSPMLTLYVSEAALQQLAKATTEAEALLPRTAGLCELLLAQVARVDVILRNQTSSHDNHIGFETLLAARIKQVCNPGRELFRRMKATLGAQSISNLLDWAQAVKTGMDVVDESTLKRWSSGREFPREEKLQLFVETTLKNRGLDKDDRAFQHIGTQYWAARRLHKLLEIVRRFLTAEQSSPRDVGLWSSLLGGPCAEQWVQQRYTFWLSHWQASNIGAGNTGTG